MLRTAYMQGEKGGEIKLTADASARDLEAKAAAAAVAAAAAAKAATALPVSACL